MKLIYIAGDERSGSTLLDMMLAGHSEIISLGEAHQITAYATKDKSHYTSVHEMICYCGEEIDNCKFWQATESHLGRPLDLLQLKPFFLRSNFQGRPIRKIFKKCVWLLLQLWPGLYRIGFVQHVLGGVRAAEQSMALYNATNAAHGGTYVLDSSKSLFRLFTMSVRTNVDIKVLLLNRDYRGVVGSKVKRGMDVRKAAYQWKWVCRQMDVLTRDMLSQNVYRVKYEDLCIDTENTMLGILDFLGLPFESAVLVRNHQDLHHLGGSPSKYVKDEGAINVDDSHKNVLSDKDIRTVASIVAPQCAHWGYE